MEGSDPSSNPKSEESSNEWLQLIATLYERIDQAEQQRIRSNPYEIQEDLGAQIQKANRFEDLYYTEWKRRRSVEEELEKAKERIKELEKLVEDRGESTKRDEEN